MPKPDVVLTPDAARVIFDHAVEAFPNECCGFLYGREDGPTRIVSLAVPVANVKEGDQRRRFEISPLDYMRAEQYALENQTQLLGVYHSHPNHPAIASEHDRRQALPYFSYLIVSVRESGVEDVKSWRLQEEQRVFQEESVEVTTTTSV